MNTINDSQASQSISAQSCDPQEVSYGKSSPLCLVKRGEQYGQCRPDGFFPPAGRWGRENPIEGFMNKIMERFMEVIENLVGVIERVMSSIGSTPVENPQVVNDMPAQTPAAPAPEAAAPAPAPAPKEKKKKKAKKMEKNGEFLWKPESDKNGNLVVLLPGEYTGKVKSVKVLSPDGTKKLGEGESSGTGNPMHGVDREHFRFKKPGSQYPDGAILEITLDGGRKIQVKIPETSSRYTR